MNKAIVLGVLVMLCTSLAGAQTFSIELDGDATLGNGPDNLAVLPSAAVSIDAWVTGTPTLLIAAAFTISHAGPATWNSYTHATGWTTNPDINQGGNAWTVNAYDQSLSGLVPPFLHGTANYTYDGPVGLVTVSIGLPNAWLPFPVTPGGNFLGNTGMTFGHEPSTATEESSWSGVKTLFR